MAFSVVFENSLENSIFDTHCHFKHQNSDSSKAKLLFSEISPIVYFHASDRTTGNHPVITEMFGQHWTNLWRHLLLFPQAVTVGDDLSNVLFVSDDTSSFYWPGSGLVLESGVALDGFKHTSVALCSVPTFLSHFSPSYLIIWLQCELKYTGHAGRGSVSCLFVREPMIEFSSPELRWFLSALNEALEKSVLS